MPKVHMTEEDAWRDKVSNRIKFWCSSSGTNQRKLAIKMRMPYSTLNKKINNPETLTLFETRKILKALNVSEDEKNRILM